MELSLSLPNAKGRFNLSSSLDSKAFGNGGRQKIKWQCSPRSTSLSIRSTKLCSVKRNTRKVLCSQKEEIPVLEGRSIEEIYDALAERLLPIVEILKDSKNLNSKYIIGLAGPPGAGKSTVAYEVACRLNKLWSQEVSTESDDVATVLPMDGFHLYRSQLDAMEMSFVIARLQEIIPLGTQKKHMQEEEGSYYGHVLISGTNTYSAPWTFNPELLLKCLRAIRNQGSAYAPSFDHGVGDPVENDVFVSLKHKVVIVEGNYLFLQDGLWQEVCSVFDEKWFLEIDLDTAMERVRKRHIATGKALDIAKWRIEYNDSPNAELIMKSKKIADLVIRLITNRQPFNLRLLFPDYFFLEQCPSN